MLPQKARVLEMMVYATPSPGPLTWAAILATAPAPRRLRHVLRSELLGAFPRHRQRRVTALQRGLGTRGQAPGGRGTTCFKRMAAASAKSSLEPEDSGSDSDASSLATGPGR